MMTRLGIYSLLAGFFVGIFTGISQFMEAKTFWVDLTISKIIGEGKSDAVIGYIDIASIQNLLNFLIYKLPFFGFLIGIGIIFLIISLFGKAR
ncbi:MAG: hypothetical protein GXP56_06020 [Deltaproteobacteria bacterium]|nr:hypothetical protein [Deltaproteobacteria bacterium]